jgi:hypothetical protein
MQDAERVVDLRLRPGSEIASTYCEQLLAKCAAQAGAILVADIDGAVLIQSAGHGAESIRRNADIPSEPNQEQGIAQNITL